MSKIVIVLCIVLTVFTASAEEITVAAGAGFRKMVIDIAETCEKDYGVKINMSFGNLGQVMAQVKTTGLIDAVVGDSRFFGRVGLRFEESHLLGNGKLVLAWRKGIKLDTPEDIMTFKVQKLAIPNVQKAIYGIAGTEYLNSKGMADKVRDKLYIVATVPQVSSYLAAGEVDAGFSNLTDIRGAADRIGGYFLLEEGYQKIDIITGILKGRENKAGLERYRECVSSEQVRKIALKHGL